MNTATVIVYGAAPSIRLVQLDAIIRIRVAENEELSLDPANVIVHFPASHGESKSITCLVLLHVAATPSDAAKESLKSKINLCLANFLKPKPRFVQIFLRRVESEDYYVTF